MRCFVIRLAAFAAIGLAYATDRVSALPVPPPGRWMVFDAFGRDVTARGVTLVDWDGHLANPAVETAILPPEGARFPVTLAVTTDEPRVYFDRGSRLETTRDPYEPPAFSFTFEERAPLVFRMAIWPDEDGRDELHTMHLEGGGVATDVPLRVIDQDLSTPITYPIVVDFSHDAPLADGTRFFDDPERRAVVVQAANDWAYFLDGTGLDEVGAGEETTQIYGSEGWEGPLRSVTNASPYKGFLLYALGVHTKDVRSGGMPGRSPTYETKSGRALPGLLRRSGAVEIEELGNFAPDGWFVSTSDETWFLYDNVNEKAHPTVTDLASVVHHEMGHALFFCGPPGCGGSGYASFPCQNGPREKKRDARYDGESWGALTSPELDAYYEADEVNRMPAGPGALSVDFRCHLSKVTSHGALDPASGLGAFGTEYADNGRMPRRRWIITKLDLLAAQAIGYPLRTEMSPFVPLTLASPELPIAKIGERYAASLVARGGVPPYDFAVVEGSLPEGLTLDAFNGTMEGIPAERGARDLLVRVKDSLGATSGGERVRLVVE